MNIFIYFFIFLVINFIYNLFVFKFDLCIIIIDKHKEVIMEYLLVVFVLVVLGKGLFGKNVEVNREEKGNGYHQSKMNFNDYNTGSSQVI